MISMISVLYKRGIFIYFSHCWSWPVAYWRETSQPHLILLQIMDRNTG